MSFDRIRLSLLAALCAAGASALALAAQDGPRVIEITAQRFVYTPNEIVVKRGETVTLVFTSKDFTHGFNIPDLKIRADLPPGKQTRVTLSPQQAGRFDFLCDNFCGAGHEEMSGHLLVTP